MLPGRIGRCRRSLDGHSMSHDDGTEAIVDPRPIHDVHPERQIRLDKGFVQGRRSAQRERLLTHDCEIEIRVILGGPRCSRPKREHLAIWNVLAQGVADDGPMIGPQVQVGECDTHAGRQARLRSVIPSFQRPQQRTRVMHEVQRCPVDRFGLVEVVDMQCRVSPFMVAHPPVDILDQLPLGSEARTVDAVSRRQQRPG